MEAKATKNFTIRVNPGVLASRILEDQGTPNTQETIYLLTKLPEPYGFKNEVFKLADSH